MEVLIECCYAGLDATALRREVGSRLKALAGVDAAFIATVDPATLLFTSAVSEEPLIEAAAAFLANELDGRDVNRLPTSPPGRIWSGRWIRLPAATGTAAPGMRPSCGPSASATNCGWRCGPGTRAGE
jgi:hypothetical protein